MTKIKLFNFIALLFIFIPLCCIVPVPLSGSQPSLHDSAITSASIVEEFDKSEDNQPKLQVSTSVTFKKIPRDSSNTNAGNHEQIRGTNQRVSNTRRIPSSSALVSGQQQRNKVSAINKL